MAKPGHYTRLTDASSPSGEHGSVKKAIGKTVKWIAAAGIAAGLASLFWSPPPAGLFFLDVGQGDSALVRAPNGVDLLIDAGPPGGASGRSFAAISPRDRSIEMLALTHQDLDHSGGAKDLIGRFSFGVLAAPAWTAKASPILGEAARRGLATATLARGDRIWLDRDTPVYLDVLWPPADAPAGDGNDGSLVTRLTYGSSSAVLTGDAPEGVERLLVAAGDSLDADILKAGHHGSKTSSSPGFVEAVSPEYAVISAGEDNRYGHPNEDTLVTLRQFGAQILSTAELGTVPFGWGGEGLSLNI